MTTNIRIKMMSRVFAGLIAVMLLCSPAFTVNAQNYFVATNGNDSADGATWETAFLTISNAISKASAGQTVAVSNGTYVLTTQLLLNKGITLQGFGGASSTIIDANLTGRILSISDSAAIVDGFTLKNGKSATAIDGVGVYMTNGTLQNCTISSCTNTEQVTIRGGGIFMSGSSCLVTNCLIEKNYIGNANWSTAKGGGVYISAGKLLASTVQNNSLDQGYYLGGGAGVYVADAGSVSNCVISRNALVSGKAATILGGGAYVDSGTVADCVITNNSCNVNRSAGGGGGVFVAGGGTVLNCMIAGNSIPCVDPTVATGGGGVYVDGGRVIGCVVSNNSSSYYRSAPGTFGGGVRMTGTSVVERCVITKNYLINNFHSARYGGGVACEGGVMRNCLIMGNKANAQGGGLYITGGTNENCTIVRNQCLADADGVGQYGGVCWTNNAVIINAIVYNNASSSGENDILPVVGGVSGVTYSCAPSLTNGMGNVTADPLFVDSGSGSGTSFTAGDYRPVLGSLCEKTGLVAGWMSTALELAGLNRLSSGQVEMGAYAAVPTKSTYVADSGNDSNTGTSWDAPFRTIQKGIDGATALGTVSVSNGTYVLTSPLLLGKACTLVGMGGREQTIIDANATGRILTIDNANAVVDGFTLKNGKSTVSIDGVGVNMTGGTLQNCTISACTNNAAVTTRGGGLYMSGSGCLVTNCVIANNYIGAEFATTRGAGAYVGAGKLLGCVVTNNTLNAGRNGYGGGGIFVTGSGAVSNCVIAGNTVTCVDVITRGGGVCAEGGSVTDCVISNNSTAGYAGNYAAGGGLYIKNAALVERCVITGNYLVDNRGGDLTYRYGGGVYSDGGIMRNCQISGNTANSLGGGVYLAAGSVLDCAVSNNTVAANRTFYRGGGGFYVTSSGMASNCTVSGNAVTCVDAITYGGGIFAAGGTVVACVVSNNSAAGYASRYAAGGGLYTTNAALVERCVITRNYLVNSGAGAYRYGGGAYSDGGIMRNCLIMGNTANREGGGLYMTGGTNENCTIVRNDCSGGNYGGVYWTNTPVIVNAIVYNNTGAIENNILPIVGSVSGVTYSCAPSLTSGTGNNITADPQFAVSGSGYGTTFVAGDYRLVAGTPCRNKGLTEVRMKTATDLDRLPRVKDFLVDMGAYERQTASGSMIKFF